MGGFSVVGGIRIGVVGGSIAGCAGALAAARAVPEAAVVVFERSAGELRERGAGIGIQHERFAELAAAGFLDESLPATTGALRRWYARQGTATEPRLGKAIGVHPFPFSAYNWGHLYRFLRERLPSRVDYRGGAQVVSAASDGAGAWVTLADGSVERFDLLLGADGYRSVVREAMFPGVVADYAGYLLWRGLSDPGPAGIEGMPQDAFFTVGFADGHLIAYRIPGDDGREHFNWALYSKVPPEIGPDLHTATSIPPGTVSDALLDFMSSLIARVLPPLWADAIRSTPRQDVFIQPIYDFEAPAFAKDRMLLLGDAGAVSRPHSWAGAVKAIQDAATLLRLWTTTGDLDTLAKQYDDARRPAGRAVVALARRIGQSQVLTTPDWAAFDQETLIPWLASLTASPDGTQIGGRQL
jgi:2-polyprenyl-6-methoxyphenol hydroxylase-like FAD-dependent oxidoreductase